jgi:predicted dehydrogenase
MQKGRHCQIEAIASRDLGRAKAVAEELKIPKAYGSYAELLADPAIEAVYNPLPNHLHVPVSIEAAEAGKHVLCEKPIALTAAEAGELATAPGGVLISEAFMVRHHPQWLRARQLVGSKAHLEVSIPYNAPLGRMTRHYLNRGGKPAWGAATRSCRCVSSMPFFHSENAGEWEVS